MNEVNSNEIRYILQSTYYYTKDHFKLLKQEDRKTLLAIIQNLSNPAAGIPLTQSEVDNLKGNIGKIHKRSTSIGEKISKIFQNRFCGRISSSKLNREMDEIGENYQKNTFLTEHHFTVKQSTDFEENVQRLWKEVNGGKIPIIAKGACESRIYSFKGNQGIYKDISPKDVSLKRSIEVALKKLLGITRSTELLPGGAPESKGFAEKLAYDLDQFLGLGFVPETNFINKPIGPNLEGNVGTLQLFLGSSYKEAKEVFSEPRHFPKPEEQVLFQQFIIFDYLIGNSDRHEENWMVQLDKEGRLTGIGAIDNGNSFIEKNPKAKDKTILKNQYRWGQHPYSVPPFTQEAKNLVNGMDEKALRKFFEDKKEELKGHPHTKTFFSDAMIQNTLDRLQVLKTVVNRPEATPQMLSEIKTKKAINQILQKK
jgi:hypothetical protein